LNLFPQPVQAFAKPRIMRGPGAIAGANYEVDSGQVTSHFAEGFPHHPLDAIAGHSLAHGFRTNRQTQPGKAQPVGQKIHGEAGISHAAATRINRLEFAGFEESVLTGKALPGTRAGHGACLER
jgi:hypothetical protein